MENLNIVTCTDVKSNTYMLGNLFNVIEMDDQKHVSFCIAGNYLTDELKDEIHLHMIIHKKDGNLYTVLGSMNIPCDDADDGYINVAIKLIVSELDIPEAGEYYIDAYRDDSINECDLDKADKIISDSPLGRCLIKIN